MSAANVFNVKAYLEQHGGTPEIRRFQLDESVSTNFEYLKGKTANIFPRLSRQEFLINWKDEEGDMVTIGSDEELIQALIHGVHDGLLKIYVNERKTPSSKTSSAGNANVEHPGVVCDGCEAGIKGLRFKCLECPDFDLCYDCCEKGLHNHHYMLRMANPASDRLGHGWSRWSAEDSGRRFWRPHCWRTQGSADWCRPEQAKKMWERFSKNKAPESAAADAAQRAASQRAAADFMKAAFGRGCRNGPPPAYSSKGHSEPQEQPQSSDAAKAEERDFLQHVGEQVSAFLEPLGINVDVDVEERWPSNPCMRQKGKKKDGKCANKGRCKPDPNCTKRAAAGDVKEGQSMKDTADPTASMESEPTRQSENKTEGASAPTAANNETSSDLHVDEPEMDTDDHSWVKVEPKEDTDVIVLETSKTTEASAPSMDAVPEPLLSAPSHSEQTVTPQQLYPALVDLTSSEPSTRPKTNRGTTETETTINTSSTSSAHQHPPLSELDTKVADAVEKMRAMGFHDDGGWMSAMLYQNNGDIYKVIDSVLKSTMNN